MIDWMDVSVGGASLAALVVGLVNLLKQLGMAEKYAPYANGLLSVLGFVAVAWLLPTYPQIKPVLEIVAGAVITFLTASGVHKLGKTSQ